MKNFTQEERNRFNNFTTKNGDCILWTGYLDKDGYGQFYFKQKNRRAHRVAYYFIHGDIQKGMVIDHTCKNRNCVNPEHLRVVSNYENTITNSLSVGAINKAKVTCKNGHLFDRKYGKQRYCSICQSEKTKRLRKKWLFEANRIGC
jgi:hypothetical protein